MSETPEDYPTIKAAVAYRSLDGVRRLTDRGLPVDARDQDGATPLIYATATDQFRIAEILIAHHADIWAYDQFGMTPLELIVTSREPDNSPDGQARLRLMAMYRKVGAPIPPPTRPEILKLARDGRWPPFDVPND
jgi:ankyrin repeat protein